MGPVQVHGQPSGKSTAPLPNDEGSPIAYRALLLLIFVIYIAPQALVPALEPLHLAKVSAIIAVIAYLARVLGSGVRWTVMNREVRLMLILMSIALISIPFSMWPGGSVGFFLDQYSKSIIVFFLVANVLTSFRRYRTFLWTIGIFSAFNAVLGIKNYLTGSFVLTYGRVLGGVSGIASNPNDLALTLNLAIPFLVYLYSTARSSRQRILVVGLIAIHLGGIVISFSRGGFVTLVMFVLWTAWVCGQRQGMGFFIKTVAGMSVLALVLLWVGPEGYGSRIDSISDMDKDTTGSSQARWQGMVGAAQGMLTHPLGVGLHMNNLVLHDMGLGWLGVHNVYLELGAELGFPGLIVFLMLLYGLIASMKKVRIQYEHIPEMAQLAQAGGGAMVAYATAAMFHPVAYHFYFYIVAGLMIACQQLTLIVESLENKTGARLPEPVRPKWMHLTRL
jgi:putative inorganic carbon (HCO3(-)) transporter